MPDHKDLTADNITSLVEYIKAESKTEVATAPFAKPSKIRPAYVPISIKDYSFFIVFFALVGLLIAAMLFAVQTKEYERNMKLNK
jgi:hypothetical protein